MQYMWTWAKIIVLDSFKYDRINSVLMKVMKLILNKSSRWHLWGWKYQKLHASESVMFLPKAMWNNWTFLEKAIMLFPLI